MGYSSESSLLKSFVDRISKFTRSCASVFAGSMWARRSQAVLWHLYGTRCRYSTGAPLNLVSTRYGDPSKDCQRPPLVICHGMFGQKQNWNSVSKAMQRRLACTIYAVDLRNHGESPWADSMKYEEMCEDVVAFLKTISKETGFSKCHLLGHSMGGRVVMRLAIEPSWQNLIDRLVVEDVSPKTYPADFTYHMGFRKYIHAMAALDMSRSRRDLLRDLEGIVPDKAVREFLLTNLEPSDVSGVSKWRCNLKAIDSNLETLMRFEMPLGNFKGPTLFVYGEKSEYVKDDDKKYILDYFPNASFKGIANSGHWVHAEQPAAFMDSVCAFLE